MLASGESENYIEVVACKFFIQKLRKENKNYDS